jgi:hypothetical protein
MGSAPTIPERGTDQRFRWSVLVWSPPPESNRRPHPYHGSAAKRRANRRLRSSRRTVGGEGMCSVADRLGGAGWSDCQHYPSVGLRATRSTACTWAAKRWRSAARSRRRGASRGRPPSGWTRPLAVRSSRPNSYSATQRGVGCSSGMTSLTASIPPGSDAARTGWAGRDGLARETICRTGRTRDRESA